MAFTGTIIVDDRTKVSLGTVTARYPTIIMDNWLLTITVSDPQKARKLAKLLNEAADRRQELIDMKVKDSVKDTVKGKT